MSCHNKSHFFRQTQCHTRKKNQTIKNLLVACKISTNEQIGDELLYQIDLDLD